MPRGESTKDLTSLDFLRNIPHGTVFVTQLVQKAKVEESIPEEHTQTLRSERSRTKDSPAEQPAYLGGYRHLLYPETGPFAFVDSRKHRGRRRAERPMIHKAAFGGSMGGGGVHPPVIHHTALDYSPRFLDERLLPFFESRGPIPPGCFFHPLTSEEDRRQANRAFAHLLPAKGTDGEPTGMSLTKIQALKTTALGLRISGDWENSTVALGFVAFERCLLRGVVNKGNRKNCMAVCLLLAWKMNEAREGDKCEGKGGEKEVVSSLAASFREKRGGILAEEFNIFVQLQFALHVNIQQIQPHIERIHAAL